MSAKAYSFYSSSLRSLTSRMVMNVSVGSSVRASRTTRAVTSNHTTVPSFFRFRTVTGVAVTP